ncbi:MAG: glycerol-3-phosphate 1-O-acyltransferase PlsY [Planctomycetota bacterium]|jgi:glycerol-3-phosphate acyltransferase PlsY
MREDIIGAACALAAGYLIGGVPFGYVMARMRGIDVREVGSGNIGATNVGRALGRGWGLLALALDIAKGMLPVLFLAPAIARWGGSVDPEYGLTAMGLGAILGHVFTPYLRFRGGKGVATSVGVFAALTHYWIALPLVVYVLVKKLTGFVSAGSIALAVLLPVAAAASRWGELSTAWPRVAFAVFVGMLILVRHRANIARLVRGEELAAPKKAVAPPADDDTKE